MNIIDVTDWIPVRAWSPTGSRDKVWLFDKTFSGFFLFKESTPRYPWEFWTEIIAYDFGKVVDVEVPRTRCAVRGETCGALIDFIPKIEIQRKKKEIIVTRVETMFEGGEWILDVDPTFDRKKGEKHNIAYLEKILGENRKEFQEFVRILIFDAIIGNTDRHQDNWALVCPASTGRRRASVHRLAPAYDNAAGLGANILEENLSKYTDNEDILERYIRKGKQHLRWSQDGENLERLSHFEFLKNPALKYPFVKGEISKLTSFKMDRFRKILMEIDGVSLPNARFVLTSARQAFMLKYVEKRRDILRSMFELKPYGK